MLFGTLHRPIFLLDVAFECTSWCELTKLVTDHRFGDVDRNMLTTIVYRDGVADHRRGDHGATGPSLDYSLGILLIQRINLLLKVIVYEWTLFQTTWHLRISYRLLLLGRRRTISWSLAFFLRVRTSGLPQGETGWRPPEVFPSPPPCG